MTETLFPHAQLVAAIVVGTAVSFATGMLIGLIERGINELFKAQESWYFPWATYPFFSL